MEQCYICYDEIPNILICSCNHQICNPCKKNLEKFKITKCPYCRKELSYSERKNNIVFNTILFYTIVLFIFKICYAIFIFILLNKIESNPTNKKFYCGIVVFNIILIDLYNINYYFRITPRNYTTILKYGYLYTFYNIIIIVILSNFKDNYSILIIILINTLFTQITPFFLSIIYEVAKFLNIIIDIIEKFKISKIKIHEIDYV